MTPGLPRRERLPLAPGTLGGVVAAAVTLACSDFVRSGVYAGYLINAAPRLFDLPKAEALGIASTAMLINFLVDTVMRGPAGALLIRYGTRWPMLLGAALSLLAMALMAFTLTAQSFSPWPLYLISALHGLAFSVMWPGVMSLTADAAHTSHQGRVLTAVTLAVFPLIGAGFLLLSLLADRPPSLIFALVLGVQALGLLLALFIPKHLTKGAGQAASPPSLSRLKLALRALAPLIPAAFMQTLTLTLLGPLLFTLAPEIGLSRWHLIAVLGVGGLVAFASMPLTGKFADGGQARAGVMIGYGLLGLGLGLIATTPPPWAMFPLAALVGLGYAFLAPGWAALVVRRLPEQERPAAWGALMTVENVGTSLGPRLGTLAYGALGVAGPFLIGAVLALLTAAGYLVFRHTFDHPYVAGAHEPAD